MIREMSSTDKPNGPAKPFPSLAEELDAIRSPDMPLVDSVYTVLRDAICTGRFDASMHVAQIPLAEELNVSRTPVRDALYRLAADELVRPALRGFVVNEFNIGDVLEIYDVRLALEPLAVEDAVGRHSRTELAELADNCDRSEATAVVRELYELNRRFHAGVVAPCGNGLLIRMLGQLWQLPASLRLFHMQANREIVAQRTDSEHRLILEALEAKDGSLAVQRARDHIIQARQDTLAALKDEGAVSTPA